MRVALDTNVLAYAEGVNGQDRKDTALLILRDFAEHELMVPAQALGELFVVLTRKAKREAAEARSAVLGWSDSFPLIDTTPGVILEAMELVTTHRLAFWDSVMLAGAAQAGCRLLLSEDMQDGFTWRGVTVRNPFAPPRSDGAERPGDQVPGLNQAPRQSMAPTPKSKITLTSTPSTPETGPVVTCGPSAPFR